MAGKNPIKFTDTTFRDGHQSLLATRMRSEDIIPFMARMDQMGYFAIEVWGGATFDTTHRFLGDDPWERIRTIKGILKKTPTMMLLRGQNLVGYRNYADDLTYRFVRYAAEAGVDIFRVFDALNDMRNWEVAVKALMDAKKAGLMAHFQAAVCYSLTQRRMGGPIFNLDYYVNFAKKSEDMGADSVVLKDMAGMCSPNDAYAIIKGMKETIKIPVEFHTHYTSGSGSMSYLKAIEAGVDVLDTCLSPFALRTSQPAIEPLIVAVEQTDRETDMDLAGLIEIGYDLEKVAKKYRDLLDTSKMAQIDTGVLLHQIPGGMYSNLVNQLKELDALDRIHEVMEDLPQTRQEINDAIRRAAGTAVEYTANLAILRNFKRAEYSGTQIGHFGLAFDDYTHFTSPIRRYPDLVVHRLLKAVELGKEFHLSGDQIEEIARHCTETEQKADELEKQSTEKKRIEYYADLINASPTTTFKGYIVSIKGKGMIVELPDSLQRGMITFASITSDWLEANDEMTQAVTRSGKVVFSIGQEVNVALAKVDSARGFIDFVLANQLAEPRRRKTRIQPDLKTGKPRIKSKRRRR